MTGLKDLRALAEVARVVATRIRQDADNIDIDVRHPRLTMEHHAKDLDRLADELDAHTAHEITHLIADGEVVTSCCGRTPFELPRTERLTVDQTLRTCGGQT